MDVARGLALFGMMATHVFDSVGDDGSPTAAATIAAGRSAATFTLVAGVSVAFLSGGRDGVHGPPRSAASAGLAVRALLIGVIGLLLAYAQTVEVILPFYALMFLLAVPLLALRPVQLFALSGALVVLGPVLLVALARTGLEFGERPDATPVTVVTDPGGLLEQLFLTGAYPVVVYAAYLCAGLAVGRLDLGSRRVAGWLLGAGIALATAAQVASWALLRPLGGLDHIAATDEHFPSEVLSSLLWEPEQGSSWDYLAVAAPHTHTPLDIAHVLGSALAVLGAALLLTRIRVLRRLLAPLAAAGSMTLTLYSAHVIVLESDLFEDDETALYLSMVTASLVFAVLSRRSRDQGPLEELVAIPSTRTRRAVLARAAAAVR